MRCEEGRSSQPFLGWVVELVGGGGVTTRWWDLERGMAGQDPNRVQAKHNGTVSPLQDPMITADFAKDISDLMEQNIRRTLIGLSTFRYAYCAARISR